MPSLLSVKTPANGTPLPLPRPRNDDVKSLSSYLQRTPPPFFSGPQTRPSKTTAEKLAADESSTVDNRDLGPFLLKLARDAIAAGENPNRALDFASRAAISFERCSGPGLELASSLQFLAAVYCSLGRYEEAVPPLERSIELTDLVNGSDRALAKFCGYMQLGDIYSMLGQLGRSISCYESSLKIQIEALGDSDSRIAETCRHLAEAYIQAMHFDEAEKLCKKTLDIHRRIGAPASLEEAADRRLMALVCEAKGELESALEHLVLASMTMIAAGQDNEVAAIDVSIGNIYLSLCRFDEAIFSYQKALAIFKSIRGEDHPTVGSVFIHLADLYYRTGKLRESRSCCENALRIYAKPAPGTLAEEIARGITEISAIYEALKEHEEALKLLKKATMLLEDYPGQRSIIAGIEAQTGVMFYMAGRYAEARSSFANAVEKMRASGESHSAFFGIVLNQMGLASVQLYKIDEAAQLFEEAREILEQECGPRHLDTLGVYSNLAATYDAMGRVVDAIEILEYILKVRKETLGTANPDVADEKIRLAKLLKEVGRTGSRKGKSLENLLDFKSQRKK